MKDQLYRTLREVFHLTCISELLGWDQQVNLPEAAGPGRAEQLELVATLIHQRMVDPQLRELLAKVSQQGDQLSPEDQLNVREIARAQAREATLPASFVAEQARTQAEGYQAWVRAKAENNFGMVRPKLEKLTALARQEADLVGYEGSPYNALFDKYEPYGRIEIVRPLLTSLAEGLREILPSIVQRCAPMKSVRVLIDPAIQKRINERVARDIGYSFAMGRLDAAPHPFMTTLGPKDFRITTRYHDDDFLSSLFSTLHEAGHALYESGCREEWIGTPAGRFASLGVHESQSRLWENLVGRSRPFAEYLHGVLQQEAPALARVVDSQALWDHTNRVMPSFVRVEADEVTYSLHIVIRMLLEEDLVTGKLEVADLPDAWNALYERYLGIRPPSDKLGVLQDVHWYSGSIGYFPTYALGNLYGASFMEAARRDIPSLDTDIASGAFGKLLGWLRTNIHHHGMRYQGPELVQRISGAEVSAAPFIRYIERKFEIVQ